MRSIVLIAVAVPALLTAQNNAAVVARGKYLTEKVAVCQSCHTPQLESGELDKSKWMKGAEINIAPIKTIPKWHKTAPDLTPSGTLFKKWGPVALVKFLETGKGPSGNLADPPMPAFRLNHQDALAAVEYLKTLH